MQQTGDANNICSDYITNFYRLTRLASTLLTRPDMDDRPRRLTRGSTIAKIFAKFVAIALIFTAGPEPSSRGSLYILAEMFNPDSELKWAMIPSALTERKTE
jgi:hypothetical protein